MVTDLAARALLRGSTRRHGRRDPRHSDADLLIVNGRIWSGDPQIPAREAVAIKENRIAAVDTELAARDAVSREATVIDGRAHRSAWGLIDAHNHTTWPQPRRWHRSTSAFLLLRADLTRVIGEVAEVTPPGRGSAVGPIGPNSRWSRRRVRISTKQPGTPSRVYHVSVHHALVGTPAMRARDHRRGPGSTGGRFVRDVAG